MSGRSRCSGSLRSRAPRWSSTFALRQGGGTLTPGDLLLFAAVAASAIGYAFSGRLTASMPGWEVISWALVIALPLSLPAAVFSMPADLGQIALKPWLALLYVALFPQWIGFFAWNAGLAMGGIARVSQMQLLQPFITFALASIFIGEPITPQILLFAAAVVVTVAISTRTRSCRGAGGLTRRALKPDELSSRLSFLFGHDLRANALRLSRGPLHTFPDHACVMPPAMPTPST